MHYQSHSIFIIAPYLITQNASKNYQTQNTLPKYMKSYRKFKNNIVNPQYHFLNFPQSISCTRIAITAQFTPKQVSLI